MLGIGFYAFYSGWQIHSGQRALLAYLLGALAVGVGLWRLTRKPPELRRRYAPENHEDNEDHQDHQNLEDRKNPPDIQ